MAIADRVETGRSQTLRRIGGHLLRPESTTPTSIIPSIPRNSLRWLGITALVLISATAGYLGAEFNRQQNQAAAQDSLEGLDLDTRQIMVDIADRYMLTNQRINDQGGTVIYLAKKDKLQDQLIAELQSYTGINRPIPTAKPRPTVTERLKPQPTRSMERQGS